MGNSLVARERLEQAEVRVVKRFRFESGGKAVELVGVWSFYCVCREHHMALSSRVRVSYRSMHEAANPHEADGPGMSIRRCRAAGKWLQGMSTSFHDLGPVKA